ncbi:transposase [Streptomyces koyangensis]|uniref:Transposase n=1 Tax=Streptomyces koyangensis TaxID=188770 RepID=A0ABX7EB96_9ACTN|nr:transposase [Streptomyces koyangensis]
MALVLVPQLVEGLTGRQAAEAVRARTDWKYALGLELTDTAFDYSVLPEFRDRPVGADGGGSSWTGCCRQPGDIG